MQIKRILFFLILCSPNYFYTITENEIITPTIGEIINDVVGMTDDIAEIIITCKTEKDPKKIKLLISKLVKALTNIIESIIEKRKSKKLNRSISIDQFDFSNISANSLEKEIEQIVCMIIEKAGEQ